MGKIIKKHSSFLSWVLLPSLLLVVSVFGVNFISRPGLSNFGDICNSNTPCVNSTGCFTETCPTPSGDTCAIVGFNSQTTNGTCFQCGVCGNGRCEPGESAPDFNSLDLSPCPQDCAIFSLPNNSTIQNDACLDGGTCNSFNANQCCPAGCQGDNPAGTSFDPDCCTNLCGDGFVNTVGGETCDGTARAPGVTCLQACRPAGLAAPLPGQCTCCGDGVLDSTAGEQCEPALNNGTCNTANGAPGTCNNQCQCTVNCGNGVVDPGEQCDPPNGTTCSATCQTILQPVCGNGIVETGEQCEGTTCSVTLSDGKVDSGVCQACQCIPDCIAEGSGCGDNANTSVPCAAGTGGTTTGGATLVPVVHPTVLAQWIAAFTVPGAVFTGLRARRKKK